MSSHDEQRKGDESVQIGIADVDAGGCIREHFHGSEDVPQEYRLCAKERAFCHLGSSFRADWDQGIDATNRGQREENQVMTVGSNNAPEDGLVGAANCISTTSVGFQDKTNYVDKKPSDSGRA